MALTLIDGKMSAVQFEKISAHWQETYETLMEQRRMLETKADAGTAQRIALQSVEAGLRSFVQVWDKAGPARQRELLNSILEWLRLVPENSAAGFAELRMKLYLLPEMSAPVPRSQTKKLDAEGVDRLSLRGLAILAHLAEGRSREEAARLLGVCDVTDQLQILRETAGIEDFEELVEAAKPRIEALRAMLPMGEPPAKAGDDDRPPVTPRTQEICELYASGMTQEEIGSRLGILSTSVGVALLDARRSIRLWLDRHSASPEDLPAALRYVFEVRRRRPRPKPLTMTPRLRQVLDLMQQGKTTEEIAQEMGLTVGSARVYRSNARKRLKQVTEAAAHSGAE